MTGIWRKIASAVLLVVAIVILIDFAWEDPNLHSAAIYLNNFAVVIGAFSLGIGAYSMIIRHTQIIARKGAMWPYSVIMLLTMFIFTATGLITGGITSTKYLLIYRTIVMPVQGVLYGMVAFWIASACYRAFRAKNWEASLLIVAAIFIMLKNAPIGGVISPILPAIGTKIFDISGATGMRGILIGIGIGTIAMSLRVIIGQEKAPMGGAE